MMRSFWEPKVYTWADPPTRKRTIALNGPAPLLAEKATPRKRGASAFLLAISLYVGGISKTA
jgi:hypothetical protein